MRRLALIYLVFLFPVIPVSAQVSGRLTGSVQNSNGAAIAEAIVRLFFSGADTPVAATATTSDGLFSLTGIRPDRYDLTVEAGGFQKYTLQNLKIDPALETSLPAVSLVPETLTLRVEVTAAASSVQTANSEIGTIITTEQVRRLPVLDRSALALIQTQAGVNSTAGGISVNGTRTSSSSVSADGINVQDNYIRGSLTYTPNLLALDQISEFTLLTSNANASMGGGASHVVFVTPSGTNDIHGSAYFYNRNNALAANTWFNNKDGVDKPTFNQNQIGGTFGAPIRKDKLFFYGNYEAFRFNTDVTSNSTILTQDARAGIFTYVDSAGQVRKVNVLQAAGVSADPTMAQLLAQVPSPERANNFRLGDSRESLMRNTAGYSFLRQGYHNRDNVTLKLDKVLSTANSFTGSFLWNRQTVSRSDLSNDFSSTPKVRNDDSRKLIAAAWRWNPRSGFTNELRGGFNLAPLTFSTSQNFGEQIVAGTLYSNPVNLFRAQGRKTNTFNVSDNAAYSSGKHSVFFGFQTQHVLIELSNQAGITPTYSLGTSFANALGQSQLPGISAADLAAANSLLATLAGYIAGYAQTFNTTTRSSGFVSGAPFLRHYRLNDYAAYVQDAWRVHPRVTLNVGLRYELPGVVDERDSLILLPVLQNGDPVRTLLSNAQLDFAGSSAGRPWYQHDKNNFAPNVSLAWDLSKNGTTALRAGYSVSYVNDETIRALETMAGYNEGLVGTSARTGLSARISDGFPAVPAPVFQVPRTFGDNFRLNPFTAFGMPDPNLRTPYVQQWSLGIQREIERGTILEVRYVGNHSTKLFRGFDLNPEITAENGFLDDFRRAQSNGDLARAANGVFNPNYNPAIPGSQPLTVFPNLVAGGLISNPVVLNLIQTGQAGELGFQYFINALAGSVSFYKNPVSLASLFLSNTSNASYNSLQVDLLRRFRNSLQFQANYTYGKVLSDSDGTSPDRFEGFRDPANGKIDRLRPSFDVTHALKANGVYDLPDGNVRGLLKPLVSGWAVSGLMKWQSGNAFSVLSRRGTLLRAFRSAQNTAASPLTKDQLDGILQFRMTADGPFIVSSSAIAVDGRGVPPDGSAPFAGQAFFNPDAGRIGGLQRRWFSGPSAFDFDAALMKSIRIDERQSLDLRMEMLNVLNHPTWFVDDQDINAVGFGRIRSTANSARRIQLSARYSF